MLKLISSWFLAIETPTLQIPSKVSKRTEQTNSLACTMKETPCVDKPLPLNTTDIHQKIKFVQSSDKTKPLSEN